MQSRERLGNGMPNGIIISTTFILRAEKLEAYDTDQEVTFTGTLLYNKAPED